MNINITDIIERESVEMLLQVILSPHEDFAVGIEALARGIDPITNVSINPNELFEQAKIYGLSVELDKLCIKKAIKEFTYIYNKNKSTLLFINIEDTFISYSINYNYLIECADQYNIPYENIAIDLSNFNPNSLKQVETFIDKYRKKGFYMSIDDIGQDYFNLDKLLLINPDIIKINTSLLQNLESELYRDNLLKFISVVAHEMGMVVVAKGIETDSQLTYFIESGAQFVQGYYIARPSKLSSIEIDKIINDFKNRDDITKYHNKNKVGSNRNTMTKIINFMDRIKGQIDGVKIGNEENSITKIFKEYSFVENCWILDMDGLQVSDALINKENFRTRNSSIFNISKRNMDFSEKEIYERLVNNILDVWITKPFHSLLTNNICIGVSKYIVDSNGVQYILCLNININRFNYNI
ncbi:histidine kinase [Vallitalea longa]|uniref:Histidine kinase n=1 Tax=Vallitalea longa TaxID=2936439 RepID=A0A9W6DDX8_9FIRM|nr:EAL domain-containing protein [Vallitalea longa]GKX29506.1 histidine kinase [Vallitalea longa]